MFEKMHITVSYLSVFGKYVEPLKKNRISVVKSTEKCWMDVTMSILLWFLWTSNFNIFLLEATRLTINPPLFPEKKKRSQKLMIVKILMQLKCWGIQKLKFMKFK